MVILVGILCLLFMCISIIVLASIAISLHQIKKPLEKNKKNKDPYSYLFEVYDEY